MPRIPHPKFDSPIVEHVVVLSELRSAVLTGSVLPEHFFQLKRIFQFLESLQSARIEGNRTTIEEFVEEQINGDTGQSESIREIQNLEDAVIYLEEAFKRAPTREIDHSLICELHRITVKNLRDPRSGGEGDDTPGRYRSKSVKIVGADHKPPPPWDVEAEMNELVLFINQQIPLQMELLRIAIAHHHLTYIHPFTNGNGRVARLLTYGMLIKAGYRVDVGRILNPTAVFVHDRKAYMKALQHADEGSDTNLLDFCEYVLGGLRLVFEKVHQLTNAGYVETQIMLPSFDLAVQRAILSPMERRVVEDLWRNQICESKHFSRWYPQKKGASLSQEIAHWKRRKLIRPYPTNSSRKYIVELEHGPLLRCIIHVLHQQGFLPFAPDA